MVNIMRAKETKTSQVEYIKGLLLTQKIVTRNALIQALWPQIRNNYERIGVINLRMDELRRSYGMVINEDVVVINGRTVDKVYKFVNLERRAA